MLPRHCREHAELVGLGLSLNAGITDHEPFAWACRVLAKAPEPFELFYPHGYFLVKQ